MQWLKDKNGALYLVAAITSVTPLEIRGDKRDQTKVTETLAAVTTAGGHTHNTSLDFDEVSAQLNPPPEPVQKPA
jgi:hypothetical protein